MTNHYVQIVITKWTCKEYMAILTVQYTECKYNCNGSQQHIFITNTHAHTHAHTHKPFYGSVHFVWCPMQPGWAGTRRSNIHPLISILVISHPLTASPCYDPWHPPCSIYMPDSLCHNLSPIWSTSWPGTLKFMLQAWGLSGLVAGNAKLQMFQEWYSVRNNEH